MYKNLRNFSALALTCAAVVLGTESFRAAQSQETSPSPAQFTSDGELIRPRDYRTWMYVGAPVTPNDMNDGAAAFPEFHSVYIDPGSYEHYKQTGEWREGTVFIKELIGVGSKQSASGNGYFMGEFIGLEAMVKSSTRFPGEPGNWAFYSFTGLNGEPPKKKAAATPTALCNDCHRTSADEQHVFTQYYPVLRAAKSAGENPENR